MPSFPNTESDRRAMLEAIGVSSVDDLFAMIPAELRLKRPFVCSTGFGRVGIDGERRPAGRAKTPRRAKWSASWAAAATTISFPPWWIWFRAAASFIPRPRPIRPRPEASKCGLGQSAPNALLSIVEHFQDEILGRVASKGSSPRREKATDGKRTSTHRTPQPAPASQRSRTAELLKHAKALASKSR